MAQPVKHGDVVWAKYSGEWWPGVAVDRVREEIVRSLRNPKGGRYVIFFDKSYTFVPDNPKNLLPFTAETKEEITSKSKVSKRDLPLWREGVEKAEKPDEVTALLEKVAAELAAEERKKASDSKKSKKSKAKVESEDEKGDEDSSDSASESDSDAKRSKKSKKAKETPKKSKSAPKAKEAKEDTAEEKGGDENKDGGDAAESAAAPAEDRGIADGAARDEEGQAEQRTAKRKARRVVSDSESADDAKDEAPKKKAKKEESEKEPERPSKKSAKRRRDSDSEDERPKDKKGKSEKDAKGKGKDSESKKGKERESEKADKKADEKSLKLEAERKEKRERKAKEKEELDLVAKVNKLKEALMRACMQTKEDPDKAIETLATLEGLAVTSDIMSQTGIGKIVFRVTKYKDERVAKRAAQVVEKWVAMYEKSPATK